MAELATKIINYITSLGPHSQVGVGALSGCLAGFSMMKIGKFAAAILGGVIIIIKIAEIEGLVQIDWLKVKQNAQNITVKAYNISVSTEQTNTDIVQHFLISFVGGCLIGIGCA